MVILVPKRLPIPFFSEYSGLAYHMILVLLLVVVLYYRSISLAPRHLQQGGVVAVVAEEASQ